MQNRLSDEVEPNRLGPSEGPAARKGEPRRSGRGIRVADVMIAGLRLLAIFSLTLVFCAVGSAVVPGLANDPYGYVWLIFGAIGSLVGGWVTGLVVTEIMVNELPARLEFLAAFGGFAVAQLVAWLVSPESGGVGALCFYLVALGVPFVVGWLTGVGRVSWSTVFDFLGRFFRPF